MTDLTRERPALVDASGKPATLPKTAACPRCGAGASARVLRGFGSTAEICSKCGFEFGETR